MPVFEFTSPDGKTYEVTGPEGATQEQAFAMLQHQIGGAMPEKQPESPSPIVDSARSIPGGLAKGAASIAGLPGDVVSLRGTAPANYPTATPWLQGIANAINPANILPTSKGIADTMAAPFGGFYDPKTTAGEYAQTISSFAPAAVAPGNVWQRLLRVLAPSVTSETAGQLTKGTVAEPYARLGGAIVGGGLEGLGEGYLAERAQTAATPTTAQVKDAANQAYKSFAGQPVTVTPEMQSAISGDLGKRAVQMALEGTDANREAALSAELRSLLSATPPQQVSVDAADKISQALRDIGRGALRGEEPNANLARGAFARRSDVETAVQQVPGIKDARALWSRAENSKEIDAALTAAINQSQTPSGAGGLNQAIRREFGKLVRDENFMNGLSSAEQDAIKRVSNGTFTANTLQQLGKFSPVRNHLAAMGEVLGGIYGGLSPEMIGLGIGGEASRYLGTVATLRNARLASETVRSGGTTVPQIASSVLDALLRSGPLAQRVPWPGLLLYAPSQESK